MWNQWKKRDKKVAMTEKTHRVHITTAIDSHVFFAFLLMTSYIFWYYICVCRSISLAAYFLFFIRNEYGFACNDVTFYNGRCGVRYTTPKIRNEFCCGILSKPLILGNQLFDELPKSNIDKMGSCPRISPGLPESCKFWMYRRLLLCVDHSNNCILPGLKF